MIKHIVDYDGMPCYNLICDSCKVRIASCIDFEYNKGQELVYAPLLCESCGQKHNKDVGDDVFRLKKLEQYLQEENIEAPEGYKWKYYVEKEEEEE